MYLQKVGRISRKRFVVSEETLVDILKARLKGEKNVSVRRYIRQKIKLVS
jgi:hypothetical protein